MWLKLVCVLGALILLRTNTKLELPLSLEVGFLEGAVGRVRSRTQAAAHPRRVREKGAGGSGCPSK